MSYKFSELPNDSLLQKLFREIQDHFISADANGNVVVSGDITCQDLFASADSIYIGGIKLGKPLNTENNYYVQYDFANQKFVYSETATSTAHASSHESGGADTIDHDSLTGFVANEHIDWTSASQDFSTTGDITVKKLAGNIITTALSPSNDLTVSAGYGSYVPDEYEIANTYYLEIANTAIMEIG